ncbi:MAG TPA: ABC transporter ATP-binding protein, partial [Tepidiformaceae bacterium]|nr:ABC transporter ATP-binding protein [Tepidiformaceae bacterium]
MIASVKGLSYRYPSAREPTLSDVTFDVAEGSFTLVAGPSAGGKSTLLRVFNGLVPQFHGGALAGSALIAGHDPSRTPARRMATLAGMVFQEPESQAVTDVVEDEIVTGMEQHSVGPPEMGRRLEALLPMLGIERLRHRQLSTLSGGERQRVAIAA